jgi:peptide-methionine (R)-S-oxide reductase
MDRRRFLLGTLGLLGAGLAASAMPALFRARRGRAAETSGGGDVVKIHKSEDEWRELLTPEQFRVLRKAGTEPAGSSPLNKEHRDGTYVCAGCDLPLFDASTKFDSGTGWPSFYTSIEGHTETKLDFKLIYPRTEYHCARCGGHQGHIFDDGPPPTGQRWCNNGVALRFIPKQ